MTIAGDRQQDGDPARAGDGRRALAVEADAGRPGGRAALALDRPGRADWSRRSSSSSRRSGPGRSRRSTPPARGCRSARISALFERRYPGIAFQAVALTMGVLATMLVIYRTGAIKATRELQARRDRRDGRHRARLPDDAWGCRRSACRWRSCTSSGPLGIGISLVVVSIAALNLVLDFDFIEKGVGGRRAQVHGVVRRVRPAGDAGLAVPRDPAPARLRAVAALRQPRSTARASGTPPRAAAASAAATRAGRGRRCRRAVTPPRLPMPLPPNAAASLLSSSRQRPPRGTPTR